MREGKSEDRGSYAVCGVWSVGEREVGRYSVSE